MFSAGLLRHGGLRRGICLEARGVYQNSDGIPGAECGMICNWIGTYVFWSVRISTIEAQLGSSNI